MSFDRVLMVVAAAALVSGCGLFSKLTPDCHTRQEYQRAGQVPPLKVPAGLDTPHTPGPLVIPTLGLRPPPPGPQKAPPPLPPPPHPAPPHNTAPHSHPLPPPP